MRMGGLANTVCIRIAFVADSQAESSVLLALNPAKYLAM
jgi:hypothetical protein